jgi:putative addiction module antidote
MNDMSTINKCKVTTVGNSAGITLPKEVLAKLRIGKGDYLTLVETQDGYLLTPYDSNFAKAMEAAETIMRENRDALRELAK